MGVVDVAGLLVRGGHRSRGLLGTDAGSERGGGFQRVGASGRLPDRPRVHGNVIHHARESSSRSKLKAALGVGEAFLDEMCSCCSICRWKKRAEHFVHTLGLGY